MKHMVKGDAKILCVHTSEPFSEGASYTLPAGASATISRSPWYPTVTIENVGERKAIFAVEHNGDIRKPANVVVK